MHQPHDRRIHSVEHASTTHTENPFIREMSQEEQEQQQQEEEAQETSFLSCCLLES